MRKHRPWAALALLMGFLFAACGGFVAGIDGAEPARVVRANLEAQAAGDFDAWLATLEAERRQGFTREMNGDFGVLSLTVNSLKVASDPEHMALLLESDNARRLGLRAEHVALVDADYDVLYDGARVPSASGTIRWRYILIRPDADSPWLIRDWGYGRGGV